MLHCTIARPCLLRGSRGRESLLALFLNRPVWGSHLRRPKERQVRKIRSEKPQRQVRGVRSVERAAPERKRKGLFRQLFR